MKQYARHLVAIAVAIPLLFISYQNCSGQFKVQDQVDSAVASAEDAISADEALKIRNGSIIACPMISCAAPPENCSYQPEDPLATTNRYFRARCPSSCGKLVCKGPRICPMLACAAPPEGCQLVPDPTKDENGCSTSCGRVVCNGDDKGDGRTLPPIPVDPPTTPICPQYMPPPNLGPYCRLDFFKDENGCQKFKIVCDPKPRVECPLYTTVEPRPGCRYVYSTDNNGCQIRNTVCGEPPPYQCPTFAPPQVPPGCFLKGGGRDENGCSRPGALICTLPPIEEAPPQPPKYMCPMMAIMCVAPPEGCRYGAPTVNEYGCTSGCGNLICEDLTK